MIKWILLFLAIIVIVLFVLASFLPNTAETSRKIVINKPQDSVAKYLRNIHAWEEWMPWKDLDSASKYSYPDNYEGVGAIQITKSGEKSLRSIIKGDNGKDSIWYEVEWNNGENISYGSFKYVEQNNKTTLTWKYKTMLGESTFAKLTGVLMDNIFGTNLENGLKKLKKIAEK